MRWGFVRLAAMLLGLAGAWSGAEAAWLRAESAHFVIYANTPPSDLQSQAVELERFDALLRRFHATEENQDVAFNKVTIYVLSSVDAIRRLTNDRNIAGFYVPRVTGSVAFTPRLAGQGDVNDLSPRIVLFHEYAHHFMLGSYANAYPKWFSEGYAEFASTATKRDGAYWLGAPANHRAYGLLSGPGLPAAKLFDPPAKMTMEEMDALYGRGWLLTHYSLLDAARFKQLGTYLSLYGKGVPSVEAAKQSFGDLKALDRALDSYVQQRRLRAMRVTPESLGDPKVEIAPLSEGQAAMIDMRVRSTAGVNQKTAPPLYARAAPVAARYPNDAVVQGWFAEIATDAGQLDAAERAADAALVADPRLSQALLYKARILMVRAVRDKSSDEKRWDVARGYVVRANRIQNNDAAALVLFYESFLMQGITPRDSAKRALDRALELVPQDPGTRYMDARQQILDNRVADAKRTLRPLAADPHAGPGNAAALMLAALDAGKTGEAVLTAGEANADKVAAGKATAD